MEDNVKKAIVFFVAIVIFIGSATGVYAAGNKDRYVEKNNFAITVPETWEIAALKGCKYKILQGKFENNFTPTINFVDEEFDGEFNAYVEYFLDQLDNTFGENREYILYGEIITNNGLKGKIIVMTTFQKERMLQFNFFCFPGKNGKNMIITCSNLANDNARFNALFVNTIKTFEFL
jgi:hypothetical protein